jgi:hypothetical protein
MHYMSRAAVERQHSLPLSAMPAHELLAGWDSFYVITGSSAAALTGLQFVVMTLVSASEMRTGTGELDAFGTPTIVHFSAVLLFAAVATAPWSTLSAVAIAFTLIGALGVMYGIVIARRARRTTAYKPVLEDWLWHVIFPFVAYTAVFVSGLLFTRTPRVVLFPVAASALLLLFVGIHNSWDTVTYITIEARRRRAAAKAAEMPNPITAPAAKPAGNSPTP